MAERDRERYPGFEPRDEDLSRLWTGLENDAVVRPYEPPKPEPLWRVGLRRIWAPIVAVGLLLWKFKFIFAAIFKFKLFTVAGSMLVSLGAYALIGGWRWAAGLIALLFIHEMGHAVEAKRQGLKVSAPMFIPFMGAVILMKQMPKNAFKEAQVALAGPIIGSLGAVAFWVAAEAYDSVRLREIAFTGFFLNLFNLLPITPLDGGRAVAAIHPALWAFGLLGLLGLAFVSPNPLILLILVIGGLQAWERWRTRHQPEQREYYSIPVLQRVSVGVAYLGLAALLVLAMGQTFVERSL